MSFPFRANLRLDAFGRLVEFLRSVVERFPDKRTGDNILYTMADAALGAFSVFFTQSPSFLDFQHTLQVAKGCNNALTLFGIRQLPQNNVTLAVACASLRRYSRITPSTKLIEMEKAETQLTDAVIRTIRDAARKLTGPKRRQFQAQVALDYFGGSARKAQTVFGWSVKTVALGLNELRTGITCVDSFAMRGRRKSEDAQPQLLEDIVALVEPQSQTDPKFQGRFQYTRMTAKAVRQALIDEKDWLSFVWCGQGVRPDWLPWDPGVGLPLRWKPGSMVTASGLRVDKAGMSRATVGASRGQLSSVSVYSGAMCHELPPACPHSSPLCPHCAALAPLRARDACGATTTGFLTVATPTGWRPTHTKRNRPERLDG